jgi:tRNA 2-thiouridine synthesizing protein E
MGQLDTSSPQPTEFELDEDGFLTNPSDWNRQIAEHLAQVDGFPELSEAQWRLLQTLREHYLTYGYAPMERHVCFLNHLDKLCLEKLFNNQYREAWRIAGLPNPGEEYKSYM